MIRLPSFFTADHLRSSVLSESYRLYLRRSFFPPPPQCNVHFPALWLLPRLIVSNHISLPLNSVSYRVSSAILLLNSDIPIRSTPSSSAFLSFPNSDALSRQPCLDPHKRKINKYDDEHNSREVTRPNHHLPGQSPDNPSKAPRRRRAAFHRQQRQHSQHQ
jgi:hypothetical protein